MTLPSFPLHCSVIFFHDWTTTPVPIYRKEKEKLPMLSHGRFPAHLEPYRRRWLSGSLEAAAAWADEDGPWSKVWPQVADQARLRPAAKGGVPAGGQVGVPDGGQGTAPDGGQGVVPDSDPDTREDGHGGAAQLVMDACLAAQIEKYPWPYTFLFSSHKFVLHRA